MYEKPFPNGECEFCGKNPHAVALGQLGGAKTSKKKAKSSRENGKKGGRPKKNPLTIK